MRFIEINYFTDEIHVKPSHFKERLKTIYLAKKHILYYSDIQEWTDTHDTANLDPFSEIIVVKDSDETISSNTIDKYFMIKTVFNDTFYLHESEYTNISKQLSVKKYKYDYGTSYEVSQ